MNKDIIEQCYEKSIELLKNNSCEFGFLASAPQKKAVDRNYLSVFSRDASVCCLGALASGDKKLIATAKKSLVTLAKHQADNGQIPNYVKPGDARVDFWRLGCIDATLWWLIAVRMYSKHSGDRTLSKRLKKNISKACFWLECQKHVEDNLLMEGEASDWADIMPRSGKVLHANSLWCFLKKIYNHKNKKETIDNFNNVFYPFGAKSDNVKKCNLATFNAIRKTKDNSIYYSFIKYLDWGRDVDVYSNALAILFDLPAKQALKKIVGSINKKRKKNNFPIPSLFNPIKPNSKMWRRYMESHNQNYPFQYHNGGIWPYISCFWVMALAKTDKKQEAWVELEKIAEANKQNNWQFNEWLHAKTGKPSGMKYQSWNAGMFIVAYQFLEGEFEF
jgi:hypothetical protein